MAENRRIVVNLNQPSTAPLEQAASVSDSNQPTATKGGRLGKYLLIAGALLLVIGLSVGIWFYWQWSNLQKSPSYSLALLVNASRKDDQKTIDQLLDSDAVVDSFVPQIKEKAKERYGRGLSPAQIQRTEQMIDQYLTPVLPGVKAEARTEIPRQIKEKAADLPEVSPAATAIALGRLADVSQTGEQAIVKANLNNRPLELTMRKSGDKWKIVAVKDEQTADRIAQQVAEMVQQELNKKPGQSRNPNRQMLEELRRQFEQLVP